MITRQYGEVAFECDNCDEVLETEMEEFADALSIFRGNGWKAEKVGAGWVHTCPACRSDGGFRDS